MPHPFRFSIILIIAVLALTWRPTVAADPPAPVHAEIRIRGEDWHASAADIEKVLSTAANQILLYFPEKKLRPIFVDHWETVPITLDQKGPNGEFQVRLTAQSTFWAQYSYQFAHELGHVLAWHDGHMRRRHQWFEEALCETSSLFVLSKLHNAWTTEPPYPNWKTWGVHFDEYLNQMLAEPERRLPSDQTMSQWMTAHLPELDKEQKVTEHSKLVAAYMLAIFQEEPKGWETITWLNTDEKDNHLSFEAHLAAWKSRVPERDKKFVGKLQKLFGYVTEEIDLRPQGKGDEFRVEICTKSRAAQIKNRTIY